MFRLLEERRFYNPRYPHKKCAIFSKTVTVHSCDFLPCVIQYQCDFEYYWPRWAERERADKKELKLYVTKNGHKNHKFERVDGRS